MEQFEKLLLGHNVNFSPLTLLSDSLVRLYVSDQGAFSVVATALCLRGHGIFDNHCPRKFPSGLTKHLVGH